MKNELNDNDRKLISFCEKPKLVAEISKHLKIAPKNVYARLDKLHKAGEISVRKDRSGKTYVVAVQREKMNKYILEIIKLIKQRGGEVTQEEYALFPFYNPDVFNDPDGYIKQAANNHVIFGTGLVKRKVQLTEQGKKFLEENDNDKE